MNALNMPVEKQIVIEVKKQQDPTLYFLQETHTVYKDTDRLKGWREVKHADTNQKKAGVAVFTSDQLDRRARRVTTVKPAHPDVGSVLQEDVTDLPVCVLHRARN